MEKKHVFSLRKSKLGAVSVLLGAVFLFAGGQQVAADDSGSALPVVLETIAEQTEPTGNPLVLASETVETVAPEEVTVVTALSDENPEAESLVATESISSSAKREEVSKEVSGTNVTEAGEGEESTPVYTAETPASNANGLTTVTDAETVKSENKLTEVSSEQPLNNDSNAIITVPETWKTGYKGEGMVVAIIDSGLDVEHDVLAISDLSKAKYKSEAEMTAAMAKAGVTYGKWYNDKVIFGYNYVDANSELKEADAESHGMHVTGIATGNPSEPVGGELISGVAPEAQVMFMRVFSDVHNTTGPALYSRAILDAVKLGADSINLSLGSAAGSVVNAGDELNTAIAYARKSGVSVVMAGGNDGTFGSGVSNPLAENPDYGLVGNPSTAKDAISVASYNNTTIFSEVVQILGLEDNAELNHGKSTFANPNVSKIAFETNKAYELVDAGLGREEDFTGKDFSGKLALIKRGELTFTEKIANATAHGALGVVIYNHTAGANNINMSLDAEGRDIPSIFIPYEFGTALANDPSLTLMFKGEMDKAANKEAGILSDFSSWGLTADGELKPDLAAPGGSIYSSINDGKYATMSGTSMASPHVAGATVLVKQYLNSAYPDKTLEEIESLIKHLMMSTATLHTSPETGAYTSPRQQGAGILDTAAAVSTGLYLTGSDDYGSITLGNVSDTFSFDVTIHNITDQSKTLRYVTHVDSDNVEDGYITLTPRELTKIEGETITVAANSSQTVHITVDASAYAEELSKLMPNGYYLEGFVRFLDPTDGGDVVSIPYVGFRGEFQNLDVLESSVYDLIEDGKGGVYFAPKVDEAIPGNENFTGLITTSNDIVYSNKNQRTDSEIKTLGTFKNSEGNFVLELDESGQPRLAISPNADGNQDSLALRGVFLRNYRNLVASVYSADDTELSNPLWQSDGSDGYKNFFSNDPKNEKSSIVFPTEFSGLDKNGQELVDGLYKYVLTYYPEVIGAEAQTMAFDIIIDRQSPVITTATYDTSTYIFTPRKAIEYGPSAIVRDQVFYLVKDEEGNSTAIETNADTGKLQLVDNRVYISKNADGSFTLPLDLADLSDFYYTVEDFAGNIVSTKVEDLVAIGNELGLVDFNLYDSETKEPLDLTYSFAVKDANGNLVTNLPRNGDATDTVKLPFGTYTVELFIYDTEGFVLDSPRIVTVNLTEDVSRQSADFYFTQTPTQAVSVRFNQDLPVGTRVALINDNGMTLNLPAAKYSAHTYGKDIPVGHYTISVNLPTGYEILEELTLDVTSNLPTLKTLTLVNKTTLMATAMDDVTNSALYYNASAQAKEGYDKALQNAQTVIASKQTQETVDQATQALLLAKAALDGQATDLTGLLQAVADAKQIQSDEDVRYQNASAMIKSDFNQALVLAQAVLAKEGATQKEVDEALKLLTTAQANLDGKEQATPNPSPQPNPIVPEEKEELAPAPPIVPVVAPKQPAILASTDYSEPKAKRHVIHVASGSSASGSVQPIALQEKLPETGEQSWTTTRVLLGYIIVLSVLGGHLYLRIGKEKL
ncbi:S8 family serine peptidase [Streptococcus caprae]|uniref:S8 family serine peptidase n=1 Tax=Streptococcus caprae TaxID=1640501 RepID=A0ABV8CXU3_9STRE